MPTIPGAFVAAASRAGTGLAVIGDDERLTYDGLHALARALAGALVARLGEGSEPVVVVMDRGALHAAAMLGVLGAGKAYLLLDPADPPERNAFLVADSSARLVLTTRRHRDLARTLAGAGPRVVAVEDVAGEPGIALDSRATPDQPCCLVYTSGSSGTPKGVMHTHARVTEPVLAYAAALGIGPADRLTQLITMSGSTTNLVAALAHGATLMPFDVRTRGTDALAAWLARERITIYHSVASVFRRVMQGVAPGERLHALRVVRLSGETLTRGDLELMRARAHPEAVMWLSYAATEVVSIASLQVRAGDPMPHAVLPGGFATPGGEILVLDERGQPVPAGQVGEIAVRGRLVFEGYWRHPELDAGVLTTDAASGLRTYRTGDRGRLDAHGCLHVAGRGDAQVKVRGVRVEPAEVEQALRDVDGVDDAVVLPHELRPGDRRLVAFVAGAPDALPDRRTLRARVRAQLPEPFVPARFFGVDALPLLPGGKVDRRALADSVLLRVAEARSFVPPRDPVEETLAEIWRQALDVESVGIHDDFFLDLAGDSLAAVRVLTRVAELFGRELPVSVFLDATTVEAMAVRVQHAGWQPPDDGRLVLHAGGARPPLFAVCGAQGHALRLLLLAHGLGPDQPFHGLQPPGMDWERAGCRTIEAMAACYLEMVRTVQPRGPYHLLGTSLGGVLVFEMAVALERAGERVATLAMVDTLPPACVLPDGRTHHRPLPPRTPPPGDGPLLAMGERVAHAHRAALERYVLRARFGGRLTYFLCTGDPAGEPDPRALWAELAVGGVDVVPVPGHHGHFHREPQLSAVTAGLRRALAASSPA